MTECLPWKLSYERKVFAQLELGTEIPPPIENHNTWKYWSICQTNFSRVILLFIYDSNLAGTIAYVGEGGPGVIFLGETEKTRYFKNNSRNKKLCIKNRVDEFPPPRPPFVECPAPMYDQDTTRPFYEINLCIICLLFLYEFRHYMNNISL